MTLTLEQLTALCFKADRLPGAEKLLAQASNILEECCTLMDVPEYKEIRDAIEEWSVEYSRYIALRDSQRF